MSNFVNNQAYKESITIDEINQLIYSLYSLLNKYGTKHFTGYFYGFFPVEEWEAKFSEAYDYLEQLRRLKEDIYFEEECACYKEYGQLVENARTLIGLCSPLRIDLIEDSFGYDDWVLYNPDRVAREVWEECLYKKCSPITYQLALDLSKSEKNCTLVYSLVKAVDSCNFTYKLTKTDKECTLSYTLLQKEVPNCNITYNDYVIMHSCGISIDVIKQSINCGAYIEVNQKNKCIDLIYNLKKHQLSCYE